MKNKVTVTLIAHLKRIWVSIGFAGLLAIILFGNLIYMNLRSADPILPGWEEYNAQRFSALIERGDPLLVEVYASWCPTCLAQHKAFENLIEEGRQPNVRAIRVDFDRDVDFRTRNSLNYTGILIFYRDGKEVTRVAGLTSADKIEAFLLSQGIGPIKS
ncbi:thioredoxin family protein [Kordiimonas aquimaris]|uniref:thioredoxin family protein n=1 Tax=Kordiimonas aquimaris TaxID=707591 RepID=UPI0021D3C694|nr:thioredoxin family protein [Kordiimonas aquimaris]